MATRISLKEIVIEGSHLEIGAKNNDQQKKNHRLSQNKIKALREIEFIFDPLENEWNRRYEQYKRYIKEMGTSYIPRRFIYEEEKLGAWVDTQKKRYKEGKLSKNRIRKLLEISNDFLT